MLLKRKQHHSDFSPGDLSLLKEEFRESDTDSFLSAESDVEV